MDEYRQAVEKQRAYFASGATLSLTFRREMLRRLYGAILARQDELLAALRVDLAKPAFEGYETELGIVLGEIRHTLKHLKKWARPRRVATPVLHFPSKSTVYPEPLGVVLVMSPWNYPLQLTLAPLVGALSAGNCAVLKPSRYAAATAAAVEELIKETFPPEYVTVFQGGAAVNQALLDVKFDHIFFTGSPSVGRVVMEKAACNLTPVTLELGGKSPCIVAEDADVALAAKRIAWGKCINSGQTCVAPDYLLVHRSVRKQLIAELKKAVTDYYGEDPIASGEYCKIISDKHFARLTALLADGEIAFGGRADEASHKIEPTVMVNVREDSPLLTEEIFGPILPLAIYDNEAEIFSAVRSRPKPLALYLFTKSARLKREIVSRLSFGGGCINDTVVHLTNPNMHFGGVGESGMGAYHGETGFVTFSHLKPVLEKSLRLDIAFRYPPYGKKLKTLKKLMK